MPRIFSGAVGFPNAEKLIGRSPVKLVDYSMVNIAPTNLVIYVSSVFCLVFETLAFHCPVRAGEKENPGKPNGSGSEIAHFVFDAVKLSCKKHTLLLLLSN